MNHQSLLFLTIDYHSVDESWFLVIALLFAQQLEDPNLLTMMSSLDCCWYYLSVVVDDIYQYLEMLLEDWFSISLFEDDLHSLLRNRPQKNRNWVFGGHVTRFQCFFEGKVSVVLEVVDISGSDGCQLLRSLTNASFYVPFDDLLRFNVRVSCDRILLHKLNIFFFRALLLYLRFDQLSFYFSPKEFQACPAHMKRFNQSNQWIRCDVTRLFYWLTVNKNIIYSDMVYISLSISFSQQYANILLLVETAQLQKVNTTLHR